MVSKLFRAYGLYNLEWCTPKENTTQFQSSFELTGYITNTDQVYALYDLEVSKLFRAYGLYNSPKYLYITSPLYIGFKALSSLRVI